MGNVSSICCQETKGLDHKQPVIQKKWQFQFAENPKITNQKILERLKLLELQPLIIGEHPGAKEQPPMKQTNKEYVYFGSWLNDIPDGYGEIYFKNGEYFEGEFFEGVANGIGRYIFENGSYFQGQIKQNQAVGEGKYISEQFEFFGEFIDSKPAKGKYILSDNTQIILQSPTNGIIHWSNGNKYKGQISNINPQGHGTLQFVNGSVYQGTFTQGKIQGNGTFTWVNGTKYIGKIDYYEGDFHNGVKHGKGQLYYRNGTIYIGDWKNGKQQGLGKIMKQDKQIYSSFFIQGSPTTEAQYSLYIKSQIQQKQVLPESTNHVNEYSKSQQIQSSKKDEQRILSEIKPHNQIIQDNESKLKKQSHIKQNNNSYHNKGHASQQKIQNINHNQLSA